MQYKKLSLALLAITLLGIVFYSCKRTYQEPSQSGQSASTGSSLQMAGYETEKYFLPLADQKHEIIINKQTLQTDVLQSAKGTFNNEINARFLLPVMVTFSTNDPELKERLKTDSVSIGYKLMQNNKGQYFAMPFPVITHTPVAIQLMGCDNCNGCDEGSCGGGTFCWRNLPLEKDTLKGELVLDSNTLVKHQMTTRNIHKNPVELGVFSYPSSYNNIPVTITIEYRLAGITDNEPQNRPSGKWCGCCIGTYCWAWWTTDIHADCASLCEKLNQIYKKMQQSN